MLDMVSKTYSEIMVINYRIDAIKNVVDKIGIVVI